MNGNQRDASATELLDIHRVFPAEPRGERRNTEKLTKKE